MIIPELVMNKRLSFLVAVLFLVALFLFLGNWGVIETSEARYAEIAREMVETGDWLHPRLLNIHHYHKPPLTYWITALSYFIFGVNSFAARFFLRVCFIVQLGLVYSITRDFFRERQTGFFAMIIYATLPLVLISVSGLTTDAYLNTAVLASVWSWIRWRITQRLYWLYLFAFFIGAGFLIKGPLVLIIPVLLYFGVQKFFSPLRYSVHHILAVLFALGIGLSWYIYLVLENENFIAYFVFHHTVERLTNDRAFGRHQPFWYYLAYVPLLALPWTFLFFNRIRLKKMPDIFKRIFISWILVALIFFSLSSSKLVLYVLPLFPGLAILFATMLEENKYGRAMANSFFVFLLIMWITFLIPFVSDTGLQTNLLLLIIPVLAMLAFIFIKVFVKVLIKEKLMLYALTFGFFLLVYAPQVMGANELRVNSTRPLSQWIIDHHLDNRNIIVYNNLLPSVAFHLNKSIITVYDGNSHAARELQFETSDKWKDFYYDLKKPGEDKRFSAALLAPSVLIVKGDLREHVAWIPSRFHNRQQIGEWTIFY